MEIVNHVITKFIKPRKLIFKNELYKITRLAPKFEISSYMVKTINGNIDMIFLNVPHPNAIPKTGEFCIANSLRKNKLNENSNSMIISMLSCFNLDDCYFTPWDEIQYEKQEVMGVWKRSD